MCFISKNSKAVEVSGTSPISKTINKDSIITSILLKNPLLEGDEDGARIPCRQFIAKLKVWSSLDTKLKV